MKTLIVTETVTYRFEVDDKEEAPWGADSESAEAFFTNLNNPWAEADYQSVDSRTFDFDSTADEQCAKDPWAGHGEMDN